MRQNESIRPGLTRRMLLKLPMVIFTAPLVMACGTNDLERSSSMISHRWSNQTVSNTVASVKARLLARPKVPTLQAKLGLQPLGLGGKRDGLLYVPTTYQAERPAPLVLMLHGAGREAQQGLAPFQHLADAFELILLAIDSREQTWDIIGVFTFHI